MMTRKRKQETTTVQITSSTRYGEDNTYARAMTGNVVDVGLPDGNRAVLHESPPPNKGWRVTHEQSGFLLGFGQIAEDAVVMACDKIAGLICAGTLEKELAKAVKVGAEYRRKLWEHAGNFVI